MPIGPSPDGPGRDKVRVPIESSPPVTLLAPRERRIGFDDVLRRFPAWEFGRETASRSKGSTLRGREKRAVAIGGATKDQVKE